MCRNVHLEVCCEDQELHPYFIAFLYTLRTVDIVALCQERLGKLAESPEDEDTEYPDKFLDYFLRQVDKQMNGGKSSNQSSRHTPGVWVRHNRASGCRYYDPDYVRNERLYYSTCDDCVRKRAAAVADFSEEDLRINLEFNHALLGAVMDGVRQKEYFQLARDFYFEFGITRRYIMLGSRWIQIELPHPDSLTLRPDPPLFLDVPMINWFSMMIPDALLADVARTFYENQHPLEDTVNTWLDGVLSVEQEAVPENTAEDLVDPWQELLPEDNIQLDGFPLEDKPQLEDFLLEWEAPP
ncbi:hypothetical protein F4818DRAFT_443777 [Hypoxylon cercidicola]|nr:hypothetical protein F4818DRAFT_443777 [Hypoxylon cercidicola]